MDHPKIEILWNSVVEEAYGNAKGLLGGVKVKNVKTGAPRCAVLCCAACAAVLGALHAVLLGGVKVKNVKTGAPRCAVLCCAACAAVLGVLHAVLLGGVKVKNVKTGAPRCAACCAGCACAVHIKPLHRLLSLFVVPLQARSVICSWQAAEHRPVQQFASNPAV